jgi:hypothetical protein
MGPTQLDNDTHTTSIVVDKETKIVSPKRKTRKRSVIRRKKLTSSINEEPTI